MEETDKQLTNVLETRRKELKGNRITVMFYVTGLPGTMLFMMEMGWIIGHSGNSHFIDLLSSIFSKYQNKCW